jgi:hypothetical protein
VFSKRTSRGASFSVVDAVGLQRMVEELCGLTAPRWVVVTLSLPSELDTLGDVWLLVCVGFFAVRESEQHGSSPFFLHYVFVVMNLWLQIQHLYHRRPRVMQRKFVARDSSPLFRAHSLKLPAK